MKNYKLVGEDERSFHLHDGKGSFLVAKNALGPVMHDKIRKLPAYADGGMVDGADDGDADRSPASLLNPDTAQAASDQKLGISDNERAGLDAIKAGEGDLSSDSMGPVKPDPSLFDRVDSALTLPGEGDMLAAKKWQAGIDADQDKRGLDLPVLDNAQPLNRTPAVASTAGAPMPSGPVTPGGGYAAQDKQNLAQETSAVNRMADVNAQAAKEREGLLNQVYTPEAQAVLQKDLESHQARLKQLNDESEKLFQAAQQNKIDPNRVWNNMSTGNRIVAAISLILGGAGSGGNSANNAALNVLNRAVDRDIEAQKTDIENRRSLYQMNMERYKNEFQATEATRTQMLSVVAGRMQALGERTNNLNAKNNADLMIAQMRQQNLPNQIQFANADYQNTLRTALNRPEVTNMAPEQRLNLMQHAGVISPEQSKQAFTELTQAKNVMKNRDALLGAYDQAMKENTVGGRAAHGLSEPASISALNNLILPLIKDNEGKVQEFEQHSAQSLYPSPGDMGGKSAAKRAAFIKFIDAKSEHPFLNSLGIDLTKAGRYNAQGKSRFNEQPPVIGQR